METARGESCLWDKPKVPPHPGKKVHTHVSENLPYLYNYNNPGTKRRSTVSILPRRVWKPQPNRLVAFWLGLMEPACGQSCISGQRQGPATHWEDRVSSPGKQRFHISTTLTNPDTKTQISRVDAAPHGVETTTQLAGR